MVRIHNMSIAEIYFYSHRNSSPGTCLFVGSILCGSVQPDQHRGTVVAMFVSCHLLYSL